MTLAECNAAIEHIRAAPKNAVVIDHLCHRPESAERTFPSHLDMSVESGIEGDRWPNTSWLRLPNGAADPRIQVSILSLRVLELCWRDRSATPHPGDPLVVDMDLSERNLPVGTRLAVGGVILEVSDQFNSACSKWQARYGGDSLRWINLPELRADRLRGILCRIVVGGRVQLGDTLQKHAG